MGLFKDDMKILPLAGMVAGAILLASYGFETIDSDKELEISYDNEADYNHEKYPELYENYEEYVTKIGEALKECNQDRKIVRDFAFYLKMLKRGYISYGPKFNGGSPSVEFHDLLGSTIASGEGVCRHASYNLADVLCSIGYDAKVVVGKEYVEGNKKPENSNHAVVYVVEDGIGYLLDPINGTILLKRAGLAYYDIRSQEDYYICFEPEVGTYNPFNESEACNMELLSNIGNDFKKHWDILKEFKEYQDGADDYLDFFFHYEIRELLENEKNINNIFNELGEEQVLDANEIHLKKGRKVLK